MSEILELWTIVYTPDGFISFLTTPMPIFGNRTALQLIENDEAEHVFSALAQDYEGLGY